MNQNLSDAAMNWKEWKKNFSVKEGEKECKQEETYSYKKVHHKKYIECKVDLLCNIVAPFLTAFHFFIWCIDEINDEGCYTENKYEDHLKTTKKWEIIF